MPAKVALLGTGLFANMAYLPVLLSSPDVELVAVWSRSQSAAEEFIAKIESTEKPHGYWGAGGLDKLLIEPDVQAIIMLLPITTQPQLVLRCLEAGKHVMSEKPIADNVALAKKLISIYEEKYKPNGLIWRVAENYSHEPIYLQAAEIIRDPAMGPVMYWQQRQDFHSPDGSMWQTEWRAVPDHQGGFILDGGVHVAALLRTVLPTPPSRFIAYTYLHHQHMAPYDMVTALALPPESSFGKAHGQPTRVKGALDASTVKQGQTAPHGTMMLSWASSGGVVDPAAPSWLMDVTCLNGVVRIAAHYSELKLRLTVRGSEGSTVKEVQAETDLLGVKEGTEQFAREVVGETGEENRGEPRAALWDLAVVEALLTSNGKEVIIDELLK